MIKSNAEKGKKGEIIAAKYLNENGYSIIASNYYSKYGEIDIIAKDGDNLVFVEVKYRKSNKFGTPAAAVTHTKRKRIILTAKCYIAENEISNECIRFDVVEVFGNLTVKLLKGAFIEEHEYDL